MEVATNNFPQQQPLSSSNDEDIIYEKIKQTCLSNIDIFQNVFVRDILPNLSHSALLDVSEAVKYSLKQSNKKVGDASANAQVAVQEISSVSNTSSSVVVLVQKRKLEEDQQSQSQSKKKIKTTPKKKKLDEKSYLAILGTSELPNAIAECSPITSDARAEPYCGVINKNKKKPKVSASKSKSDNVNFNGSSSRSFGSQNGFSVVTDFDPKRFQVVSNTNTATHVTVKVPENYVNGLTISTCGQEVFNKETGHLFKSKHGHYACFPISIGASKSNTYFKFTAKCKGLPDVEFNSPIFDCSSTAIDSQSPTKSFFKRQNLKLLLKNLSSTSSAVASSSAVWCQPGSFLLKPTTSYDSSKYSLIRLICMASAIPTSTGDDITAKLILIDENGVELVISWAEGSFGECISICENAVITSTLLIKKGVYRAGFFHGEKKKVQFIVNLFDNSVTLNDGTQLYQTPQLSQAPQVYQELQYSSVVSSLTQLQSTIQYSQPQVPHPSSSVLQVPHSLVPSSPQVTCSSSLVSQVPYSPPSQVPYSPPSQVPYSPPSQVHVNLEFGSLTQPSFTYPPYNNTPLPDQFCNNTNEFPFLNVNEMFNLNMLNNNQHNNQY